MKKHYDIGSRVCGFIAHLLAAGLDVNVIDIRPFPAKVDHLHTIVDDATMLNQFEDESIESMFALCALEHFRMGRYLDLIDPEVCFMQIQKKMKKDGNLYLALPVGRERVEFNAHRVFYAETVKECFARMQFIEFSSAAEGKLENNCNGNYKFGWFHFVK